MKNRSSRSLSHLACITLLLLMLAGSFLAGIVFQKSGGLSKLRLALAFTSASQPVAAPTEAPEPTQQPDQESIRQALTINPNRVSLNQVDLMSRPAGEYAFLAAGHIYGRPGEEHPHPASTFVEMVPSINAMNLDMLFLLGDIVPNPSMAYLEELESSVLDRLEMPVFNAVGNHDVRDRAFYERRYGPTYYTFQHGPAAFIILDTEIDPGRITLSQKAFFEQAVEAALLDPQVKTVFVMMHKVLFIPAETVKALFESGVAAAAPNAKEDYGDSNFDLIIKEILVPAARQKPVYLVAGDVGAWGGNFSPYYQKHPDVDLTMLAAGFGDTEQDAAVWVKYNSAQVEISYIHPNLESILDYSERDLDYYLAKLPSP